MAKFSAQHYNAIAKDIREELAKYADELQQIDREQLPELWQQQLTSSTAVLNLTMRLAERFKKDNERFDPVKFLDACSPNTDLYPLSELWQDEP